MSSESRPNDRPTKTRRSPPIKQTLQLPHALKQREVRAFLTHFFSFHFKRSTSGRPARKNHRRWV